MRHIRLSFGTGESYRLGFMKGMAIPPSASRNSSTGEGSMGTEICAGVGRGSAAAKRNGPPARNRHKISSAIDRFIFRSPDDSTWQGIVDIRIYCPQKFPVKFCRLEVCDNVADNFPSHPRLRGFGVKGEYTTKYEDVKKNY
jgi:hypothetical protein